MLIFNGACFKTQEEIKKLKRPKAFTIRGKLPIPLAINRYAQNNTNFHGIMKLIECYPAIDKFVNVNPDDDFSLEIEIRGLNRHINSLVNKEIEHVFDSHFEGTAKRIPNLAKKMDP